MKLSRGKRPPSIFWNRDREIVGHLDDYVDGHFRGWALDIRDQNTSLEIVIRVDGREVATASADLERPDLLGANYANANHGFDFYVDMPDVHFMSDMSVQARHRGDRKSQALHLSDQAHVNLSLSTVGEDDRARRLAAESGVVLIDVQDIMAYLQMHNTVTGIQRVVGGIIQSALRKDQRDASVLFCTIAERQSYVRILDDQKLLTLVDMAMEGTAQQADLRSLVDAIRMTSSTYRPKRGDTFFIAGAYWVVPDFGPRLNALRDRGVIIGTYIYDLIPITAPEWVTDETRDLVTNRAIDILFLSDFFLTISEYVMKELQQLLALEVGAAVPVVAVPLPHQLPSKLTSQINAVRQEIADLPPFVLCVGTLEGRKNHILLFRVWAALLRIHGPEKIPPLVLVGKWGWNIDRFREAYSSSHGLNGHIRIFDKVGDVELSFLFEHCLFTTFASFAEGWGLPVGESLSFGKLCVASNATSIPEVGGSFCDYFNPHDYFSAYHAIENAILDREGTQQRNEDIANNFQRRTWDMYEKTLLASIRQPMQLIERLVPALAPLEVGTFSKTTLAVDPAMPWRKKTITFARMQGWFDQEPWGVWSTNSTAIVMFKTTLADTMVTVMSELRHASVPYNNKISICDGTGRRIQSDVFHDPSWVRFDCRTNASGLLAITYSTEAPPLMEPHRNIFIGLSRFFYFVHDENSSSITESLLYFFGSERSIRLMPKTTKNEF